MIRRLLAALDAVDPQPTAEEIADAIWLAEVRTRLAAARSSAAATRKPGESVAPEGAADATLSDPAEPPASDDREAPAPPAPEEDLHTLRLPQRAHGDNRPVGTAMRSPGVPAIHGALAMARALRPLHRKVRSRRELVLDEDATAVATAETGSWLPQQGPDSRRWLDLALVVDDSPSMLIWDQTVAEFRLLLERLGAFRDVRVWRVDSDRPAGALPVLHSESVLGGATGRHPGELVNPTGERAFLVVSDGIGAGWGDGTIARMLELWGRTGPVAVVQPLPQRLWFRCLAAPVPVRLRGLRPGAANADLESEVRGVRPGPAPTGLAVPVMELDARWLASWARLVAGAPDWISGLALFTGQPRSARQDGLEAATADGSPPLPLDPAARIREFRATVSPAAFDLAGYLSAAPLSLPVMRLVQQVMLPRSNSTLLAEVFLGGLVRRVDQAIPPSHADEALFDFHDGIRELLLTRLRRDEALRILHEVGEHVSRHLGAPLDFRAWLTAELDSGSTLGRSFATIFSSVLKSMGGYYAELADRAGSDGRAAGRPTMLADPAPDQEIDGHEPAVSGPPPEVSEQPSTIYPNSGANVTSSRLEDSRRDERRSVTQPVVWRGVPPRNPHFTGREDLLRAMRDQLTGNVTALVPQALHGYGGVGKTQLAVEYAHRYSTEYDLVCWIPAEQHALIRASLVDLAPALDIPASSDVTHTVTAVTDALRRGTPHRRWLLVFDNADQPDEITEFFPYASGHILVTSRSPRWSGVADTIEIDVFTEEESASFLARRVPSIAQADAIRLADKLGHLPLAIEQAAAWHLESGMRIDEFLQLFGESDQNLTNLLEGDLPVGYPRPVAATWNVALSALQAQSPAAVQLLELCAFFGSETIPYGVLWAGRGARLPSPLDTTMRNAIEMRRAIRRISRYALARVDPATSSIQVHRLVQTLLRARLDEPRREAARRSVHELLALANPNNPDDTHTWAQYAELFPHIIPSDAVHGDSDDIRTLVLDEVRYLYRRGDYESSRDLGNLARKAWLARADLGPDHEQTLIMTRHLANSVRALGDIELARNFNRDTLERLRATLGDDHEHSLVTANSYGADLRYLGRFVEALELDKDTLARHREVFGDEEPQTLRVANNLAIDHRLLGQFTEARALDEETLGRRRQILRFDDSELLGSIGNLARDLFGLGRYAEAAAVLEVDLERFLRRLGPNDPVVLETSRIQAISFRKLGKHGKACELAGQNLERYANRLGERHPLTIGAMTSLMNDLRMVGRLEDAQKTGEAALHGYQDALGENHPFTHVCASNLAIVYRAIKRPAAARELDERALAALQRLLGEQHIYTLCCAANTTNDLHLAGDHEAARTLSERTYERSVQVRGRSHPYTLACAINLAADLRAVGQEDRAQQVGEAALLGYRSVLGEDNPATLAVAAGGRAEADIEPPAM